MTEDIVSKSSLAELAQLQIDLKNTGGPSEDGNMFEQILTLQDKILKSFGLPTTTANEKLVWFSQLPTEQELSEIIKQLHKRATDHLSSDAITDLRMLREAQEFGLDPFTTLPELKITTHVYTLFVYNQILLMSKDSLENVLHELKFANNPNLLQLLGALENANTEVANVNIELLKKKGLRYVDEFVTFNSKQQYDQR